MRITAIVLTLVLPACASAPHATVSVNQTMGAFMDALNALDTARIETLLAPDVTAFFPTTSAQRVDGKEAVAAVFRDYADATRATRARTDLVPEDMTVTQSGDVAVVTFQIRNPAVVSRRTFVLRRDGASWRITHLHASNIRLDAK